MDGVPLGLVVFLIIWILFLLASMAILIHQRASPAIKHRGLSLLCLSVATNGILTSGYVLREVNPAIYPCFLVLWVTSVGIPLWFLVMGARFLRLAFLYRYNQAKLFSDMNTFLREIEPEMKQKNSSLKSLPHRFGISEEWYIGKQQLMSSKTLLTYVGYLVVFHIFLTVLIQIGSDQSVTTGAVGCGFTWELIPRVTFQAFYVFIMLPGLAFFIWGIEDTYWIKKELIVVTVVEAINFIARTLLLFTPSMQTGSFLFSESLWTLAALVVVHFNTVIIPILNSYLNTERNLRTDKNSFIRVLKDPQLFTNFKLFTVKDFSVENILFYEHFENLLNLARSHPEVEEPDLVSQEIDRMYQLFFAPGARYELNLTGATMDAIKLGLETGRPYSTTIFEEAQVEILTVMYQHSFPRFLRDTESDSESTLQ
ncbi:hypothetical protein K7432_010161 [Basidiobolus ranarum]|uniref:RGS domain-containing protein n=1 Tax=Basidiobolus ranarum TaxID=34480 RepID=A0ABR2VVW4_9FUNG